MFLVARIVNGTFSLIAFLIFLMFLFGKIIGSPSEIFELLKYSGFGILFALDYSIRKESGTHDQLFAFAWTAVFSYASYFGLQQLVYENVSRNPVEYLLFGVLASLIYVLPVVINGTYLCRLLIERMATATLGNPTH